MRNALGELSATTKRFSAKIDRFSANPLKDPVGDTDERAALALLTSGAVERFLKDVVRAYVHAVGVSGVPFSKLPERIRHHHFYGGAARLSARASAEKRDHKRQGSNPYAEALDLCRRLASVSGQQYELIWEAFADTSSNPGPDTVTDVLKRLAVHKPWAAIEKHVDPNPYGLAKDGTLANKLIADLRELVNARNRCAHGGAHVAAPQYSDLRGYLASIDAFSKSLVLLLEAELKKL